MAYDPLGVRLDGADNRLLTLLARHGKLSRDQVDAHVYGTRDRSTRHIARLRNQGLIWTTDTPAARRFYALTKDGVKKARTLLDVPFDVPDDSPFFPDPHDLAVTDWCLRWTAKTGLPLLTEREINWLKHKPDEADIAVAELGTAADVTPVPDRDNHGRSTERWVTTLVGAAGTLHQPDAITVSASGLYSAIEIELVPKSVHELSAILRSYANSSPFDGVVYFGTPPVLRRLEKVTARLEAKRPVSEWLQVRRFDDITCEWVRRQIWNRLHKRDEDLSMTEWRKASGGDPYTP